MHVDPGRERRIEETWTSFQEAGGKISYPDATVVVTCRAHAAEALAYDDALLERARAD